MTKSQFIGVFAAFASALALVCLLPPQLVLSIVYQLATASAAVSFTIKNVIELVVAKLADLTLFAQPDAVPDRGGIVATFYILYPLDSWSAFATGLCLFGLLSRNGPQLHALCLNASFSADSKDVFVAVFCTIAMRTRVHLTSLSVAATLGSCALFAQTVLSLLRRGRGSLLTGNLRR